MVANDDDIKFTVMTRSTITNSKQFTPFEVTVDRYDTMTTLRERVVMYCHGNYDIAMDKLGDMTLNIVDGDKRKGIFNTDADEMEVGVFLYDHNFVPPFTLIMPLNTQGVGGGT